MNTKALAVLSFLFFCFIGQAYAQRALQLSDETPSAGEEISLTYDIPDSLDDSDEELKGAVYYLSGMKFEAFDLNLSVNSGKAASSITVPENAKGIFFTFSLGDWMDKNDGKGYYFLIYEDENPVVAALAHKALFYNTLGSYFAGIKRDSEKAQVLMEQEFSAYPDNEANFQFRYALLLFGNQKNASKPKITKIAQNMVAKGDEQSLGNAVKLYNTLREREKADSISEVIVEKFPKGQFAISKKRSAIMREKDLTKKEAAFLEYRERLSDKKFTDADSRICEMIALAYAKEGNYTKFREYASKIENPSNKARLYNSVAWPLAEKGDSLDFAADISKKSLDLVSGIIGNPASSKPKYFTESRWKAQNKGTFAMYADTYALILSKQGNWKEALNYQRKAIAENENDAEMNERFVQFLLKNGKSAEALEYAEGAVKRGKSTPKLKEYFKQAYIAEKGSETGWDVYMAGLEKAQKDKIKAKLAKEMINEKAPAFTLTNMDGEKVSLESLKGKVVVVDFWATWCGPCKASFPGMQKAVNKFEDVEFVFVNTWERFDESSKRYEAVEKFIADNNYTFNVLYDTENEGKFDVVTAYGVSGIPTKFVIDKQGNIRFKSVGYMGSPDGELQKVSAMIALAGNEE